MKPMKTKNVSPYLVGITGGFGTGKSTVGKILEKLGLRVIDTDDIVREILDKKNQITVRIVREFGDEVLNASAAKEYINKKKLGKIVFYDDLKRKKLERLIHPEVARRLDKLIKGRGKPMCLPNEEMIFVLVPLLFEANWQKRFSEVWCVICKKKVQFERLQKKGFKETEIKLRINAQMSLKKKATLSDFVIDNSRNIGDTKKQIEKWLDKVH